MRHDPQPQEMYRHFKGNLYQVRCLAKHSETGETMVIYQAMYGDFQIYARELSSFMEEVDKEKYPNALQNYRFELFNADSSPLSSRAEGEYENNEHADGKHDGSGHVQDNSTKIPEDLPVKDNEKQEEPDIDPLVLQFLDADTYERRLEILSMLHSRIDDEMINTMAVATDIEIKEGDIEDRYNELKNCLLTFEKYECNRLR